MNKRINPALIGFFVLVAASLVAISVLYYGGQKYSGDYVRNVAFFRSQTHGLEIGAPVVLQGVKVGNVTQINVGYEEKAETFYVRVEFVMDNSAVLWTSLDGKFSHEDADELREKLIKHGYRARLASQSLITGKLMVELGFFPNTKIYLRGNIENEIPTIPTAIEKLWEELTGIDIDGIARRLENIIQGIEKIVDSVDLKMVQEESVAALKELNAVMIDAQGLIEHVDNRIDGVAGSIESASSQFGQLSQNLDSRTKPLVAHLLKTAGTLEQTLKTADDTLKMTQAVIGDSSAVPTELIRTLKSVSDAARSLRQLADYLERHPEALLSGKR